VTPLCILLGLVAAASWRDPLAAALHAALAWVLCWPMALASLWLVVTDIPFSLPHPRGGSLGPMAVPLAILSSALLVVASLHYFFAASAWFWVGIALACGIACRPLGRRADAHCNRIWRHGA
jgi:hypothetical protein